jgi:hypothetical protein
MASNSISCFYDVGNNDYSLGRLPDSAVAVGNEQMLWHWLSPDIEFIELCRISSYQQKAGSGLADQSEEVQTFAWEFAHKLELERPIHAECFKRAWQGRKKLEIVESVTGNIGPKMRKALDSWGNAVLVVPGIDRLT